MPKPCSQTSTNFSILHEPIRSLNFAQGVCVPTQLWSNSLYKGQTVWLVVVFFYQKGKFQYYLVNNLRNKKQASRRKDRPLWKVVISGGKRLLGRIIHSPSKLIITEPVQASYVHILRKLMQAAFPLCYPHQIGSTKKHKHTGASCQHINPAWATWLSVNRSSDLEKREHSGADMGSYLL